MTAARTSPASRLIHELKSPLTAIKGLTSTGSRLYGSLTDEERRQLFALLNEEADRLVRVLEQAASVLLLDAGEFEYDVRVEPLEPLIREAVKLARPADHPAEVEVEAGLAACCDALRLRETVSAALDNASKYSPPGEHISVRALAEEGAAVIQIVDRGPGLYPTDADLAFERCSGVRPPGYEEVPGVGLSLNVARSHLAAIGGSITLTRPPGGPGTMLTLRIPLEAPGVEVPGDG